MMMLKYFVSVLIGVILLSGTARSQDAPEISAEFYYQSLQQSIAELDSFHMVMANRGNNIAQVGKPPRLDVHYFEMWVDGDNIQLRERYAEPDPSDSWGGDFKGISAPLTTDTLESVQGRKVCCRSTGEDIVWADYVTIPEEKSSQYAALYSTSNSGIIRTDIFAPLIQLRRKWSPPEIMSGGWPLVNSVTQSDLKDWKVIGVEELNGIETVKIEIKLNAPPYVASLKRHDGSLIVTQKYRCWFSTSPGHVPLRIITIPSYEYQGKEYGYEVTNGTPPSSAIYTASDITNVYDNVWLPLSGTQEHYMSDNTGQPFDPDVLVDSLLSDGKLINSSSYSLMTKREWKILKLEPLTPGTNLWFEPPAGVGVRDLETNRWRIEGKTEEESREILGGILSPSEIPSPQTRRVQSFKKIKEFNNITEKKPEAIIEHDLSKAVHNSPEVNNTMPSQEISQGWSYQPVLIVLSLVLVIGFLVVVWIKSRTNSHN